MSAPPPKGKSFQLPQLKKPANPQPSVTLPPTKPNEVSRDSTELKNTSTEPLNNLPQPAVTQKKAEADIDARVRRISGNYNAGVWRTILADDDESNVLQFEDDDELVTDDKIGGLPGNQTNGALSNEYIYPRSLTPNVDLRHSHGSIPAGPITLSTEDFKASKKSNDVVDRPVKAVRKCRNCFSKASEEISRYTKLKAKFSRASLSVEKFYSTVGTDFDEMEWELNLESPTPLEFSTQLNSIGAQLWFITLAVTKQLVQLVKSNAENESRLQQSYKSIVEDTICIIRVMSTLESTLNTYQSVGVDGIRHLKGVLTGRSDTDLTTDHIGDEIFITAVTFAELQGQPPGGLRIWDNKVVQYGNGRRNMSTVAAASSPIFAQQYQRHRAKQEPSSLSFEYSDDPSDRNPFDSIFIQPDTLKERKKLDIYVRNITKIGWVNFESQFSNEKKQVVTQEILLQTKRSIKSIRKVLPKILKKLKRGCVDRRDCSQRLVPCVPPTTCLPWIVKMKKYIDKILIHEEFSLFDYEILRLQILTTELQIRNIISRGTVLRQKISNIISVVQLCCEFLTNVHNFQVGNYIKLRPKLFVAVGKKEDGKVVHEQQSMASTEPDDKRIGPPQKIDDADFFLNEYAVALKVIPISSGLMEFILVNRVDVAQVHSGVNFDGPRYLNVIANFILHCRFVVKEKTRNADEDRVAALNFLLGV